MIRKIAQLSVVRCLCAALVLIPLLGASLARAAQAAPNIIFFLVDDMGWIDHSVSAATGPSMGNASPYYETPTLETMAAQGMSFTHAYAMANCSPARHAFQSGQHMTRTNAYDVVSLRKTGKPLWGFGGNSTRLDPAQKTVAEMLKEVGYTTAHFGKFHLDQSNAAGYARMRDEHGYDFNFGGSGAGGLYGGGYFAKDGDGDGVYKNYRAGPGLEPYNLPYTQAYVDAKIKPYASGATTEASMDALVGTYKHITDAITDAAEEFIGDRVVAGEPFFMNLCHYAVHDPTDDARSDLKAKYTAKPISTSPWHRDAGYAALMEGCDQSLHRVLYRLKDPNGDGDTSDDISADTLVVFYSDNGGSLGEAPTDNSPLRGGKQDHWEGGLRVPMVAWWPGTIAAGTSNDTLVGIADFYATFAELSGGTLPDQMAQPQDSFSIARVLKGLDPRSARQSLHWHTPGYNKSAMGPLSVVTRRIGGNLYKLFHYYEDPDGNSTDYDGGRYELYNLTDDIGETNNLLAGGGADFSVTTPEAAELSVLLGQLLDDTSAPLPTLPDAATGEDTGVPVPPPAEIAPPPAGAASGESRKFYRIGDSSEPQLVVVFSADFPGSAVDMSGGSPVIDGTTQAVAVPGEHLTTTLNLNAATAGDTWRDLSITGSPASSTVIQRALAVGNQQPQHCESIRDRSVCDPFCSLRSN